MSGRGRGIKKEPPGTPVQRGEPKTPVNTGRQRRRRSKTPEQTTRKEPLPANESSRFLKWAERTTDAIYGMHQRDLRELAFLRAVDGIASHDSFMRDQINVLSVFDELNLSQRLVMTGALLNDTPGPGKNDSLDNSPESPDVFDAVLRKLTPEQLQRRMAYYEAMTREIAKGKGFVRDLYLAEAKPCLFAAEALVINRIIEIAIEIGAPLGGMTRQDIREALMKTEELTASFGRAVGMQIELQNMERTRVFVKQYEAAEKKISNAASMLLAQITAGANVAPVDAMFRLASTTGPFKKRNFGPQSRVYANAPQAQPNASFVRRTMI